MLFLILLDSGASHCSSSIRYNSRYQRKAL